MSHAFIVMNDAGVERSKEQIPGFVDTATSRRPDVTNMGERGILGTGLKRAWKVAMFQSKIATEELAEMFKSVLELYNQAGITAFGSRVDNGIHLSAFNKLLRDEGKLPARYAFSYEVHRNEFMSANAMRSFYTFLGTQWQHADTLNRWLWPHGISSEGAWDSPGAACLGPDLEAVSPEAKANERCPDLDNPTPEMESISNGIEAGWRPVAIHGVGSHGVRLFTQYIQNAIEASPSLTKEKVQQMRPGLAHGTMVGKPSVVSDNLFEVVKDLNLYLPINVARALREEPPVIRDRYGDEALEFLAPVKTLLENGVNVVGESENFTPNSDWYFEVLNAYVNRFTRESKDDPESPDTKVWQADEGIDRVTALKLITIRSAEFLLAEDEVGSLKPGKLADFVVIENDVLETPKDQLRDNKVIMVGIDGEIEHQTDEAKEAISIEKPTQC